MDDNVEYQIFVGCTDSETRDEIVGQQELGELVTQFMSRNQVDFSMLSVKGGYLHEDGEYLTEDTICVNIVGASEREIVRLARSLSMFMNQETAMVVRHSLKTGLR